MNWAEYLPKIAPGVAPLMVSVGWVIGSLFVDDSAWKRMMIQNATIMVAAAFIIQGVRL